MIRTALLGILLLAGPARAAPPDPASLFPAGTLAYAELRDPGAVAATIAGLLGKSEWRDPAARLDELFKKPGVIESNARMAAAVAAAFGPDTAAEVARLGPAAAALTSVGDHGEPSYAAFAYFGDSHLARVWAKVLLTSGPLRRVGEINGLPIYQVREPNYSRPVPPPEAPDESKTDATIALTADAIVVGSGRVAVADVLARMAGKAPTPPLAADAAWLSVKATQQWPGLFLFAAPARALARLDAVRVGLRDPRVNSVAAHLRFVAGVESMPALGLTFGLTPAGIELSGELIADKPTPLTALLSGPAATTAGPKLPAGATWAVELVLPEGADRIATLVKLDTALKLAAGDPGAPPTPADWQWARDLSTVTAGEFPAPALLARFSAPVPADAVWLRALTRLGLSVSGAERVDGTRVTTLVGVGKPAYAATGLAAVVTLASAAEAANLANNPAAGEEWGPAPIPDASLRGRFDWKSLNQPPPNPVRGRVNTIPGPEKAVINLMPPLALSIGRTKTGLTLTLRQPLTPKLAGELLDALANVGTQ